MAESSGNRKMQLIIWNISNNFIISIKAFHFLNIPDNDNPLLEPLFNMIIILGILVSIFYRKEIKKMNKSALHQIK